MEPTLDEARGYALRVAEDIVEKRVEPYAGARAIWVRLPNAAEIDPMLLAFVGLASEWEDSPTFRQEYEEDIREAAHALIRRYAGG